MDQITGRVQPAPDLAEAMFQSTYAGDRGVIENETLDHFFRVVV